MIRHGTGTVNDCYPPVISLFRAASHRARKTSRCMQMLVFLLQSTGLLAGLVPTCWAYKRLSTAERRESLIWSLGGSSTAVLSHGFWCSSLCISVSSGMLWQRWSSLKKSVQKCPFPAWCWSSTSRYLQSAHVPVVLTWYDSYCRNVNATYTADSDRNSNQKVCGVICC